MTYLLFIYFCRNVSPLDFENLATKIIELFPTENKETYYIPRIKTHLKYHRGVNPKGKLVDKYRNLKRIYSKQLNRVGDEINEIDELTKNKSTTAVFSGKL